MGVPPWAPLGREVLISEEGGHGGTPIQVANRVTNDKEAQCQSHGTHLTSC